MTNSKKMFIAAFLFEILGLVFLWNKVFDNYWVRFYNVVSTYYISYFAILISSIISLAGFINLRGKEDKYTIMEEVFMIFWSYYPLIGYYFIRIDILHIPLLFISILYLILLIVGVIDPKKEPRNTKLQTKQLSIVALILNVAICAPLIFILEKVAPTFKIKDSIVIISTIIIPIISFLLIFGIYFSKKILNTLVTSTLKLKVTKLFMIISFVIQATLVLLITLIMIDYYLLKDKSAQIYLDGIYLFTNISSLSLFVTFIIYIKSSEFDYLKEELLLLYWSFYPLAIYFINNIYIVLGISILYLGLIGYNLFFESGPYKIFYNDMKSTSIRICAINGVIMFFRIDVIYLLTIFEVKVQVILKILQYVPIPSIIGAIIAHLLLIRKYNISKKYEKAQIE